MRKLVWVLAILYSLSLYLPARVNGNGTDNESAKLRAECEVEYLYPVCPNRQIETGSVNMMFGKPTSPDGHVSFYAGITMTYAWGTIRHLNQVKDNSAYGFGPTCVWQCQISKSDKLTLTWDFSGGLIFYNKEFPAGGDYYNFMWRTGPELTYSMNNHYSLNIGYKLMHVSNGQIFGNQENSHNPAYNAKGFSVGIKRSF